jgi:hypothetical protein
MKLKGMTVGTKWELPATFIDLFLQEVSNPVDGERTASEAPLASML